MVLALLQKPAPSVKPANRLAQSDIDNCVSILIYIDIRLRHTHIYVNRTSSVDGHCDVTIRLTLSWKSIVTTRKFRIITIFRCLQPTTNHWRATICAGLLEQ